VRRLRCTVSLGFSAFLMLRSYGGEPTYAGKTLTEWFIVCRTAEPRSPDSEQATFALRSIGTNAIPYLLDWSASEDAKLRHYSSIGFWALGPTAAPAIPTLAKRLVGTNEQSAALAAWSLNAIGEPALPTLLNAITNRTFSIRTYAIQDIELSPKAQAIIPSLLRDLDSPSAYYRWRAAQGLGSIRLEGYSVVPKLAKMLQDNDKAVRFSSLQALARFGSFATPAVPAVSKLLTAEDESTRMQATNTLWCISNAVAYVSIRFHRN